MGQEIYVSDNAGNRTPGNPKNADPVLASGLTFAMASLGNDYTQAVEAGASYVVLIDGGLVFLGVTGVTSVAANREWVYADGDTFIIKIPAGKILLYGESDTNTTNVYLRKLK